MKKNAFISGASRGIGRAIAKRLAALGYNLFLTCHTNKELLLDLKQELESTYQIECHCYIGDIGSYDFVSSVFDDFSQLDVLVNNAGI
ncbi:MAG: SDR family NAD(P)-dependent oxidoreductase [Lachnospiraceae bacterium]|nr:SDR family NAD(P)-dependent oxidoreductase [Lachnospiraceae bacterium]